MLARRKPPCRCHWPVPVDVVHGDVQYACLYCGAPLVSVKQLEQRKAKQAQRIEDLLQAQQEAESEENDD